MYQNHTPMCVDFQSGLMVKSSTEYTKSDLCVRSTECLLQLVMHSFSRMQNQNISEAKSEFESRLVQDFAFKWNNNIHNYIRSFTKQSSLPSVMYFDSQKESTSSGKATIFNAFFYSVFNCDADPLLHDPSDSPDVFRTLTQLDICKAMGIDGIPNIVLKLCSESLCQPI